ncbi:MAG: hypothetical protein JWR08_1711 [Enterovirga sp.]|jgi:hypothetical protein|nr:hypothetical protein [Enterovirga sp.]
MATLGARNIHVSITRVAYDLVLTATNDTGVAKLAGVGATAETGEEIGDVDLTFWGSTPAQLKMRAKAWPARFDRVEGDYFGVSSSGEHRFDIFLSAERFFRLLDLAHGSRRAIVRLRCDVSADGAFDLVREVEISAGRG